MCWITIRFGCGCNNYLSIKSALDYSSGPFPDAIAGGMSWYTRMRFAFGSR
nr:hypothetical protein [Mycobacterium pseudoshottsii]